MEIIKVSPRGYCLGVVKSIKMTKDAIKEYSGKYPIYMLGYLVHNRKIVDEMIDLGVIPINDFKQNRLELIQTIPDNSVVILSAHGSDDKLHNVAKKKNLILVDTECEWVTKTKVLIKQHLALNHQIIFIGKHHHPETNAMLAINNNIHLITNVAEIELIKDKINLHTPILVTNQTTLSLLDIQTIIDKLKSYFGDLIIFKNDLCNATLERQQAIIELKDKNIDLLLVIGDERSSNTNKLVEIGNNIGIQSYRINNENDINPEWLRNIKKVAVTAGASTPSTIQLSVFKFLENFNN